MPLHPTVSFEDYLRWLRDQPGIESVWHRPEDISDEWRRRIFKDWLSETNIRAYSDYVTPIDMGKDWLFELTCIYQPRTGTMIMEGGPLLVRNQRFGDDFTSGFMAVEVNGNMVRFFRSFQGLNPSDDNYQPHGNGETGYEKSLPDGLGEAYFTRFLGMSLLPEPHVSIDSWALPKSISNWSSLQNYLDDFRGAKRKYLPWFNERFPDLVPKPKDKGRYFNFRCWLDTRLARPLFRDLTPTEQRAQDMNCPIDALFVRQDIVNSPIFHVVDGRLDEMRVLINPLEAVDLYCEHVLLGREERFDFIEHGRPLD